MDIITIENEVDTSSFCIDNASIIRKLEGAYYNHVKKICAVKRIIQNGNTIGYFIIGIKMHVDKEDEFGSGDENYAAIYLDLLAIDKQYQGKHYGSIVLSYIIKEAEKISSFTGCRFLLLDALNDKVGFYRQRGFSVYSKGDITTLMGIDFRDKEEMEKYQRNIL